MICPHDHQPCTGTSDEECRVLCQRMVLPAGAARPEVPGYPPCGPIDRAGYLLALIERLAGDDPSEWVMDDGRVICRFCRVDQGDRDPPWLHADDCPWVEARRVIEAGR